MKAAVGVKYEAAGTAFRIRARDMPCPAQFQDSRLLHGLIYTGRAHVQLVIETAFCRYASVSKSPSIKAATLAREIVCVKI
jgi:hypothetical protein